LETQEAAHTKAQHKKEWKCERKCKYCRLGLEERMGERLEMKPKSQTFIKKLLCTFYVPKTLLEKLEEQQ
jgi:hypothetical protein